MKQTTLYFLAICLVLASCRKETTELEGTIDTSETTELEEVVFEGTIFDKNQNGLEAKIDIYQFEEKIGTVNTDANGDYITQELFIAPDVDVTFDIYKEGFKNKYRRFSRNVGFYSKLNFNLVSVEDALGAPSQFLDNPGSSNLIRVYRTIVDVNGEPIPNIYCTVSYDHELLDQNIVSSRGGIDITDENGYMEVLVPKEEEFFHFAAPFFDDPNIECNTSFVRKDTSLFNSFLVRQYLGVLTEDHEITGTPDIAIHPTSYTVTGTLLNCDGSPVVNGEATVQATYATGFFPSAMSFSTTEFDADGNFQIDFEICSYGGYAGTLTGIGDDGESGALIFDGTLGQTQVPELNTCLNSIDDDSFLDLNIGNVKTLSGIGFPQNLATESSILALGFHPDHGSLSLSVAELNIGPNPIDVLNLNFIDPKPYGFNSQNGELTLNVLSIENDYITGTISGTTETEELGIQDISGDLYIKYQ